MLSVCAAQAVRENVMSRRWIAVLWVSHAACAGAVELADPLYLSNRNPFVAIYGLPGAESGFLPAVDTLDTALVLDIANNWHPSSQGNEQMDVDGETYRGTLRLRFGLSDRWSSGFDLSFTRHNGGFVDGLIDGFHQMFGLPDAERDKNPRDQLLYSYRRDGVEYVRVDEDQQGLSDLRWSLGYQWLRDDNQALALRAGVKVSLGDAEDLIGSETTDFYASMNYSRHTAFWDAPLTWHVSGGAMWMDDAEVMADIREDWAAFGSLGLSWAVRHWWHWKLQVDGHTALYDSGKSQLGRDSAQLTLGATAALGQDWALDIGLVEDLAEDTSPDAVFHFALRRTY